VHLVVDRAFMPGEHALLVPRTQDGRVLFAVPWMGSLVLGTTDTARGDLPREPAPFEHEVDFILREAGRVLAKAPRRDDVRSVWVGLRPLVAAAPAAGSAGSAGRVASAGSAAATPATQRLSREHTIVTDADGLVTVTGGKWTTYRAMAEDVMEALAVAGLLPRRPAGATRTHTLVGAGQSPSRSQNEARALGQGKGRGAPTAVPLTAAPGLHLYGTEADTVRTLPGVDRALGHGLTEAMVRFAARQEYALTVEDVLARRWRILFLDARAAAAMAAQVAQILREETGLDPGLEAFEGLAAQYRLDPARSTAAG
jgi:glycerol-3-phosphate dehydrogenase